MLAIAAPVCGQAVISAKAGLVYYVEGQVALGGKPVESASSGGVPPYAQMLDSSEMHTEDGRAEVLLNPRAFLRVGENSTVRMVSNLLSDTRIEFVSGAAIVEARGRLNDKQSQANSVSIVYGDTTVRLRGNGIYRFDAAPAQLRVYSGEAEVTRGGRIQLGAGESISLVNPGKAQTFDGAAGDSLDEWNKLRAREIALANGSAAKRRKAAKVSQPAVWPRPQTVPRAY